MKRCAKCNEVKAGTEFFRRHDGVGLRSRCKDCTNLENRQYRSAYRARHADELKARQAKYRSDPATREAKRLHNRQYKASPLGKATYAKYRRAHATVLRALRAGLLVKQPCEICGRARDVHGHHDDYSKPLEVRWLCPPHHYARHVQLKEAA